MMKLIQNENLVQTILTGVIQENDLNNKIIPAEQALTILLEENVIFFDEEKLYLKGWETRDIYNNFVSTEIYIREVNKIFDESLFNLNKYN